MSELSHDQKLGLHKPKAKWTPDEDALLAKVVEEHGHCRWDFIATFIPGRNGKQCRERWLSTFAPHVCHSEWTHNEDLILLKLQMQIGNHWSPISKHLPGRTAIQCKNRFKLLKRRNLLFNQQFTPSPNTNSTSSSNTDSPAESPQLEIDQFENLFDTFDDSASYEPETFEFSF